MNVVLSLPRNVLTSIVILFISLLALLASILYFTSANGQLEQSIQSLESQINTAEAAVTVATTDRAFVLDNEARFRDILASDLLIPHTRRSALRTIQEYAFAAGLTGLEFEFDAVESDRVSATARQVAESQYRVNVEQVTLSVRSYLDRPIFLFVTGLLNDIPGASALKELSVRRVSDISTQVLNSIAEGEDVAVTSADITLEWRTAQTITTTSGDDQ